MKTNQNGSIETVQYKLQGQTFQLHPFKAIFWEERQSLLLADLHLGKVSHFQKNGFPVPQGASQENWDKLYSLLIDFAPTEVIFLGDLFHSTYNAVWEDLLSLIQQFSNIKFILVVGNHDILDIEKYEQSGMSLYESLKLPPFILTHHPLETADTSRYNLAGHIHPSVILQGSGRQRLRLPCFYFGKWQGILPAFGAFTGTANVAVQKGDQVFVISEELVLEVGG